MASNPTAGVERSRPNPYVQVALTYIRRPFSSWTSGLMSAMSAFALVAFSLLDRVGILKDSAYVSLMLLLGLFAGLASHMKGQFADSRSHLMPGFRRIHATVAVAAAVICAGALPAFMSWLTGSRSIGFVAVAVLLFGTTLWVIVKEATWTPFALALGWFAFWSTPSGPAHSRAFLAGQFELYAVVILAVGILLTVAAGIQLGRLSGESLTYYSKLRLDWNWNEKTRQGWSGEGRILPGLRDWIREQQMERLTRLVRRAGQSWWARTCRWQVGMTSGISLWFWILAVLVHVQALSWWIAMKAPRAAAAMMGLTFLILTFLPAILTLAGVLSWRTFKLKNELLLPVERTSYIRQLGTAAALSHFQLWGSVSAALVLWWLLIGPRPLQPAVLGGVLAFSAAFQVAIFGAAVWMARYRSPGRGFFFLLALVLGFLVPLQLHWVRDWSVVHPGQLPHEVLWIAGVLAVFGLLLSLDAYRRWLVAEFD